MTYNFCTSDFEGPLDLLLHLVKESKMDIYEINIHDIINQYLDFIRSQKEQNIDIASEYLVMSSELIHLKSKLLINREDEEPEEDNEYSFSSEEDLRNRLLEYEKYKQLTKNFHELEAKRSEVYTKLPESLKQFYPEQKLEKGLFDVNDIYKMYLNFLEKQKKKEPLNTKITKKEINIEDKIRNIRELLKTKKKVNFMELITEITKEGLIVTFLSILQMSKNDEILLTQNDSFSPIMIEKKV